MKRLIYLIIMLIICSITYCTTALGKEVKPEDVEKGLTKGNPESVIALWSYLKSVDCSDEWSSAVIGNSMQESSVNPKAEGSGYFGAFQIKNSSKTDFQKWVSKNNLKEDDIIAHYRYLTEKYRGWAFKDLGGTTLEEISKSTDTVKNLTGNFALISEGCVCYKGITKGKGGKYHTCSSACGTFTNKKYGDVSLQELSLRQKYAEEVYTLFKGVAPSDLSNKELKNSLLSEIEGMIKEAELKGMPEESSLKDEQRDITLKSYNDLGIGEQYSLSTIGENLDLVNKANALDISRRVVAFVGLLLVVYASILLASMMLDKINTFVDISLVNLLSLGLINYSPNEETLGESKSYISTKKLSFSIIAILVIGLIIISGSIFSQLSAFCYWFMEKFLY